MRKCTRWIIAVSLVAVQQVTAELVSHYLFDGSLKDQVGWYNLVNVAGSDEVSFTKVSLANGTITNAVVFNGKNYIRSGKTDQFSDQSVTVSFTYEAGSRTLTAYINGEIDKVGQLPDSSAIVGQLIMGRRGLSYDSGNFTGQMADVRVYDTVLSGKEIFELFQGAAEAVK